MSHPFEIHVTVAGGDAEEFRQACAEANVKPILLELHTRGGTFGDLQTSSFIRGTWPQVREEVDRITFILEVNGFDVIRSKVETSPHHPAVPTAANQNEMPPGCYFESHLAITTSPDGLAGLQTAARKHGAHLSRNAFKKIDGDRFTIMLTLRDSTVELEQFTAAVHSLEGEIRALDLPVAKTIIEFALYDTNIHHDDAWLQAA